MTTSRKASNGRTALAPVIFLHCKHMTRHEQLEKFNKIYNGLNPEQRTAVDTIEGPVMVIAGPGTGKTQILSARIGKILLDTDTPPENILCLTYTDAGVVAMRRRLQHFIGAGAYKVNIFTFHAFCNEVIQENLSLFEKTALDPISELERNDLLKKLIDQLPKGNPLKRYRGDVYFEMRPLTGLFSTMKREGWTPAFMTAKIDEKLASLDTDAEFVYKTTRKGKWEAGDKKPGYQDAIDRYERLRAAVLQFDVYQELMRKSSRYDFDDMINWVIREFEENERLLRRYQEQYLYILVDEYQDTSGTQNRIVDLLINYWDVPNVFVVGDDDQSIYRFQGANVENMDQFIDRFANMPLVVLEKNYRSIQPVLDISKTLIKRNEERIINRRSTLGLSKELLASNPAISHIKTPPQFLECDSLEEEMMWLTREVQRLLAEENVRPGDIGIIYKEHKYGEALTQYFKLMQVPVYSKRQLNLLEVPLVQKIVLVLQWLAAEYDIPYGGDEMLFEILHFDWFAAPPVDIAKLSIAVSENRQKEDKMSLRRMLHDKAGAPPPDLFTPGLHAGLVRASQALEQLVADAANVTIQHLLENIIQKTGALGRVMHSADKVWHLQVLTAFFDFIKEETRRNPYMRLKQLVGTLELMQQNEMRLPLVQVTGTEKGVNLMTAHGSKGLEFSYIFVTGTNAHNWEKKRKPNSGYSYPDNLFDRKTDSGKPFKVLTDKERDLEELRRLFYVAITRAKTHLYISWSKFKEDGKDAEPSMFIAEIREEHPAEHVPVSFTKEEKAAFEAVTLIRTAPEVQSLETDLVTRLLEKFSMNVTALSNYLDCPLKFYYQNLVRVPAGKSEPLVFGQAVHFALEKLFRRIMEDKTAFAPKQTVIDDFIWYMRRNRENFTQEQFDRRLEYGPEILGDYYDTYVAGWNKVVSPEKRINTVLQGIPIKGALDKIEFNGNLVTVVDYKTGDYEKAKKVKRQFDGPSDKKPHGGDYWRQAVFYRILIDNFEAKNWQVQKVEFDFIEPDKRKKYYKEEVLITPADITTVTEQIKDVWGKIQERQFYTGCGKPDCRWCNFVKTNNLAVALHEIEDEAEEGFFPEE